ncbi:MAG: GreA/GreB family elongation factor [Polyangiales bacterium]
MEFPDKRRVMEALIEALTAAVQATASSAEDVRRSATHEEARPENDKDTRALEQTYLARGQAMRAEALMAQVQLLRSMLSDNLSRDEIVAGSLIHLEDEDGGTRCLFLAPHGGGVNLAVDGMTVVVVTPSSPLGRALLGKRPDDSIELKSRDGSREFTVLAVR